MASRMRTRSQVRASDRNTPNLSQKQSEPKYLSGKKQAFIRYNGKSIYSTTFGTIAEYCATMLDELKCSEEIRVFGFDIEWPFSFKSGSGNASVVQISPDLNKCYVLQVSVAQKLPKALTELICHRNVRLSGVCVKNDVRKLHRDFGGFDVDKAIENCIDLSVLANSVLNTSSRWSLERLVLHFLGMRINKDKSVRMSKWNAVPLSVQQIKYAALDAYVSLKLYHHIKALRVDTS